jgi:hypothetical protein
MLDWGRRGNSRGERREEIMVIEGKKEEKRGKSRKENYGDEDGEAGRCPGIIDTKLR